MTASRTTFGIIILLLTILACATPLAAQHRFARMDGTVTDSLGRLVPGTRVRFDSAPGPGSASATATDGTFTVELPAWGKYMVFVEATGFASVTREIQIGAPITSLRLRLEHLSFKTEEVIVTGNLSDVSITTPDPSEKVFVREELLDANPGRPGAPVSIPGLPIETASGGIKAPQYFVPGVAGDHGEPMAQYIAVGGYLVTNNLSANAHGNGYADPNIFVSGGLGSVKTDGGAFNVLEGNHALNLAATYDLRPQPGRFLILTGDGHDVDFVAGLAPGNPGKRQWLALEANYGNGLMKRLEHRKQFKWNAFRVFDPGKHEITVLSLGYWGMSHEAGLVPIGFGLPLGDTVDPRQFDQTHTSIHAIDDHWKLAPKDELALSGFFRTYNLALFSNFGEGLIRQSEFRTVDGAEFRETHAFTERLQGMAGFDYHEDDIHRDNLDHYLSGESQIYGPFLKVLSSNVTIRDATPYVALHGDLGRHLRFYAGLRPDTIELKNADLMNSANSFNWRSGILSPKASLAWTPGAGSAHLLPSASISMGQAFFTEDPRIAVAIHTGAALPAAALSTLVERSHSEQLVLEKVIGSTDLRVTMGRTTTTQNLGRIDPDNGTQQPLGPGTLKFLTASVRHQFGNFGTVQGTLSKADARLIGATINGVSIPAQITPEAPRTIFDTLATLDHLPFRLHARGEYEYVGHKQLDIGNVQHPGAYEAIPVGETRLAVVHSFLNDRLEIGANGMVARGYTGQTTEAFAPGWQTGTLPSCAQGSGPSGAANDFACGTNEQSVGIRMVSWAGGTISWRFGREK